LPPELDPKGDPLVDPPSPPESLPPLELSVDVGNGLAKHPESATAKEAARSENAFVNLVVTSH